MSIKSKFRAFWKIATTRVPQKGWENVRGPDITRAPSISNTFRALVFGRGRKKRFYVKIYFNDNIHHVRIFGIIL